VLKAHERKMNVVEMRMLRWALGKTRKDKIENKEIRQKFEVIEPHRKIQESRLRWYGHVQRLEDENTIKQCANFELEGVRRKGRPKRKWLDCIKKDMKEKSVEEQDVKVRGLWKKLIRNSDPVS